MKVNATMTLDAKQQSPKEQPSRMPAWFIPHGGGPCFFMDWNPLDAWLRMANFLKGLSGTLPSRPKAIVVVSAHWLESTVSVTGAKNPSLIYDYYGFPPHTYELKYPALGNPELAQTIVEALAQAQIAAKVDALRGFDHGLFVPMMLMFPKADIPVVQLSLNSNLDPRTQMELGQALQPLRDQGVLIIGSGMSFHNMRGYGDPKFGPISDEFDFWLTQTVQSQPLERFEALLNWDKAPHARQCHPPSQEEHLLPLMVAAGAASEEMGKRVFSDRVMETTLSAYTFG